MVVSPLGWFEIDRPFQSACPVAGVLGQVEYFRYGPNTTLIIPLSPQLVLCVYKHLNQCHRYLFIVERI